MMLEVIAIPAFIGLVWGIVWVPLGIYKADQSNTPFSTFVLYGWLPAAICSVLSTIIYRNLF